jgi:6-phosphogluconolactonase (cycloisomerase 2 family)
MPRSIIVGVMETALALVFVAGCGGGSSRSPAPVAHVNQSTLGFGSELIDTTAAPKVVTVSNTGNAALTVSAISLTGTSPASFSQTNTCTATLPPGGSCTVTISFKPTSAGALSASLELQTNAAADPTVTLSGTGVPAPPSPKFLFATADSNIHAFAFDTSGKFSPVPGSPFAAPVGSAPAGIAVSHGSKFLYAVDSVTGNLLGYVIHADGSLSAVPGVPFTFPNPFYLLVANPAADFLYGISGVTGEVMIFAIDSATGTPNLASSVPSASGVDYAAMTSDGRYLYVNAVGFPPLLVEFSVNTTTGALTPVAGSPFDWGSWGYEPGPTVVDPANRFLYAVNGYQLQVVNQCCVVGLQIDAATGALATIPNVSNSQFDLGGRVRSINVTGTFLIADVNPLNPSGFPVYSDSCVVDVLSINPGTGELTPVPGAPFSHPCGLTLTDTIEPYVFVVGDTCSIVDEYVLDETSGALTPYDTASLPGGQCASSMALAL